MPNTTIKISGGYKLSITPFPGTGESVLCTLDGDAIIREMCTPAENSYIYPRVELKRPLHLEAGTVIDAPHALVIPVAADPKKTVTVSPPREIPEPQYIFDPGKVLTEGQINSMVEYRLKAWHKAEPELCRMEVIEGKEGEGPVYYFYALRKGQHRKITTMGTHNEDLVQGALQEAVTAKLWDCETRSNKYAVHLPSWEARVFPSVELPDKQMYEERVMRHAHTAALALFDAYLETLEKVEKAVQNA